MQADQCILVDNQDGITGHASKHDAHRCEAFRPAPLSLWLGFALLAALHNGSCIQH